MNNNVFASLSLSLLQEGGLRRSEQSDRLTDSIGEVAP